MRNLRSVKKINEKYKYSMFDQSNQSSKNIFILKSNKTQDEAYAKQTLLKAFISSIQTSSSMCAQTEAFIKSRRYPCSTEPLEQFQIGIGL